MGQGMNQGIVQSRSASLQGSSAPLPAMWGFAHHRGSPGTKVRKDTCGKELVVQLCETFSFHWSWNHSHGEPPVSQGRSHHHQVLLSHLLNSTPFTVLEGPMALLPLRQSFVPCQIVELRGSSRVSSCYPASLWVPPGWLTAACAPWLALRRLAHGIAALPQRGTCSKGMG